MRGGGPLHVFFLSWEIGYLCLIAQANPVLVNSRDPQAIKRIDKGRKRIYFCTEIMLAQTNLYGTNSDRPQYSTHRTVQYSRVRT